VTWPRADVNKATNATELLMGLFKNSQEPGGLAEMDFIKMK
jgi:hypothetical protein